jgi:hypothetical protein
MRPLLRIKRPERMVAMGTGPKVPKTYLERLVALVPAEVISLYLALVNFAMGSPTPEESINNADNHWLPYLGLALVIIVRIMGTRVLFPGKDGKQTWDIEWPLVFISALSFIIWVYATGGSFISGDTAIFSGFVIGVAVAVWTFLVPYVYKEKS